MLTILPMCLLRPSPRFDGMRGHHTAIGLVAFLAGLLMTSPAATAGAHRWTGTWEADVQPPIGETWQGTNWSLDGFAEQSLRQVVRISAGGSALRIHVSNRYGTGPLHLSAATVAKAGTGASVQPDTLRPLTFERSRRPSSQPEGTPSAIPRRCRPRRWTA